MSRLSKNTKLAAALIFALGLSACDSAQERAEQHYQSGLKFVASGEIEKALIEFRNVFKLDGEHLEARLEYARLLTERGDIDQATSQYLRVLEQDPKNRTAHLAVGHAMLQFQNFEEASKQADFLLAADPKDQDALAIRGTSYMRLGRSVDAVEIATQLLATKPANVSAMLILISDDLNNSRFDKALVKANKAIELAPDDLSVYLAKLAVLDRMKNKEEISTTLAAMAAKFPDNKDIASTRISWMLETGNAVDAERLLRDAAAKEPDNVAGALNVVGLLEREYGIEAARAELDALAAKDGPLRNEFRRAQATMTFRQGDTAAAVANVTELLSSPIDEKDRNESNVLLAFFEYDSGNKDRALELVAMVLESDTTNVASLKLRGQIEIDRDQYDAAISNLRAAQDADPTDASVLVLQAKAHQLNGNKELARERMASAVSVSGALPNIALDYAQMLIEDNKQTIAESVLLESAQRYPGNREVLLALANVRLNMQNWNGAEAIASQLRSTSKNGQDADADNISVAILQGQNKIEQSIGKLQSMLGTGDTTQDQNTILNIVRTHVESGESDIAEKFLNDILTDRPDDYTANLLLAGLKSVLGDVESAEKIYSKVIKEHPDQSGGYLMLARLFQSQDRLEESKAVLDSGLANSEDTSRLQFMRATELEVEGDFEGAIEIYADLYEQTPGSDLLANNLASLLSEHRSDEASLDRAFTVSRRLRDSEFPPYQDTYGWVLYLRGDYEKALAVLTKAQTGLAGNPVFQYHLGMTYLQLKQTEAAVPLLEAAVKTANENHMVLPQIDAAKAELAKLQSGSAN